MSYRAPNTGDPELDKKLRMEDYEMLLPRLLEAPTGHGFACWLDKLTLIERPSIVAYVREHWDVLDQERRVWIRVRLHDLRDLPIDLIVGNWRKTLLAIYGKIY